MTEHGLRIDRPGGSASRRAVCGLRASVRFQRLVFSGGLERSSGTVKP